MLNNVVLNLYYICFFFYLLYLFFSKKLLKNLSLFKFIYIYFFIIFHSGTFLCAVFFLSKILPLFYIFTNLDVEDL